MLKENFGFSPDDVVVVTGAASGIGRATALLAGSLGLGVCAWDLNLAGADKVSVEICEAGGRGMAIVFEMNSRVLMRTLSKVHVS